VKNSNSIKLENWLSKTGNAEADPSLDINGGDARHKLLLLIKITFGIDVEKDELPVIGIENITKEDIDFADEIDARIS
jgi:homoserine dehydrogenase